MTCTVACIAVVYVSTVLAFIGLAEVAVTAPPSKLRGGGYQPKYWMQAFPRRKPASYFYGNKEWCIINEFMQVMHDGSYGRSLGQKFVMVY